MLYDSSNDQSKTPQLLASPLKQSGYALMDYPRFFVPEWNVMPAPSTVDPALAKTNGYDFRNNQEGDTYIFLLGSTVDSWHASRRRVVQLQACAPSSPTSPSVPGE